MTNSREVQIPDDEYLEGEHSKGHSYDRLAHILRVMRPILILCRMTKLFFLKKLAYRFLVFNVISSKDDWEESPYQLVLHLVIQDVNMILSVSDDLPGPLKVKYREVRGFDLFNASASPWFGENLLTVHSGVFWFSHIIARSIEPFIREKYNGKKCTFPRRHFEKKFMNTTAAYVTRNHARSISLFHFVYENDGILKGMEMFVISHEYAHLLIAEYGTDIFKLDINFSEEVRELSAKDEEVAADAIALIILKRYSDLKNDRLMLYAPILLFLLLSLYQDSKLISKPVGHPSNADRLAYIREMIHNMEQDISFTSLDEVVIELWEKIRDKTIRLVEKDRAKRLETFDMLIEFQNAMFEKGYPKAVRFSD